MVRKGEIACYKQFLTFSQFFFFYIKMLVYQNAALCGNRLMTLRMKPLKNQAFSLFLIRFSTLSKTEIIISAIVNLSSALALNLVLSKKFLFGKA